MRGNPNQELVAKNAAYHFSRQRTCSQVNAVGAGGPSDIGTIVYEQSGGAAFGNAGGVCGKLVQHVRRQFLFADLDQIDFRRYGCLNQSEDVAESFSCRSRLRVRLPARDEIQERLSPGQCW